MKVELINKPTLDYIDTGIGMCWNKGGYGADTDKGRERINRVCNKNQHSSMLRFAQYIFRVELSTSALLEFTRHQVGVDYAVKSTRYCTKSDSDNIKYEPSKNDKVNRLLDNIMTTVKLFIQENNDISNDDLKLLLPQAFMYEMQVQFNAQSLQHFLKLRTSKYAHYHIRELAYAIYKEIPTEHIYLFKEYVNELEV